MSRTYLNTRIQQLLKITKKNKKSLAVTFVSNSEIKKLNKQYRHINTPTDVLSFESDIPNFLGDIVISLDTAKRQAIAIKATLRSTVLILVVHGYLHLLGYDHLKIKDKEIMRAFESKLLKKVIGTDQGLIDLEGCF